MAQPIDDTRTFPSTCWSQIRAGPEARERALVALAERYWRPAHAYLRAMGRTRDEARDLVQDFFVWVIESGFLAKAEPERGRFRGFLKTALNNFAVDADRRAATHKRGGAARVLSIGAFEEGARDAETEAWEIADPSAVAPDDALDAVWRSEVVRVALERTRARLEDAGGAQVFAVFRDYFLDPAEGVDYRALAERHGITSVDVSNFLMRAKRAYKAELRAEVIETVGRAEDLEDELAWLIGRGA
ncbi:MAG: RNA polymerase sigma factor [Planctomycetota bacterium]